MDAIQVGVIPHWDRHHLEEASHMRKKIGGVELIVAVLAAALAGCSSDESDGSAGADTGLGADAGAETGDMGEGDEDAIGSDAGSAIEAAGQYDWRQLTEGTLPAARGEHAMVYDPAHQVTWLFGGVNLDGDRLNDLWAWDGSRWTEVEQSGEWPEGTAGHTLTYDPSRQAVVLIGDSGHWVWDGESWSDLVGYCNDACPLDRVGHAAAYHEGWGQLVVFSGVGGARNAVGPFLRTDSYVLDGEYWRFLPGSEEFGDPIDDAPHPAGRVGATMVYDPERDVIWLFGGRTEDDTIPAELWRLDDEGWHLQGGSFSDALAGTDPWGRRDATAVWHDQLRAMLIFGGDNYEATTFSGELPWDALSNWSWDGSDWRRHDAWVRTEVFRSSAAAAYDPVRDEVVQFGGVATTLVTDSFWILSR